MIIIRDPVHGNIMLNETEKKIVNSPVFQRLHRIKQLAFCYLVYPGAKHSRFEHSLGTLYLSDRIAKTLKLDEYFTQVVRLAGLLHDIGHSAFSHESEDVLKKYIGSHEDVGLELIRKSEIFDYVQPFYNDVVKVLKGKKLDIIGSDIGADRLDYLVRDAYYTGVSYGMIDSEWITDVVTVKKDKLCLPEKAIPAAESLLIGRFLMFNTVYLHKTNRIAASMYKRALSTAIENGFDPHLAIWMSDDELLVSLRDIDTTGYVQRILDRDLYKLVARLNKDDIPYPLSELEDEITKKCKCDVIIDEVRPFVSLPKVNVLVNNRMIDLTKLSSLVNVLVKESEKRSKVFVITEKNNVNKVRRTIKKMGLGHAIS